MVEQSSSIDYSEFLAIVRTKSHTNTGTTASNLVPVARVVAAAEDDVDEARDDETNVETREGKVKQDKKFLLTSVDETREVNETRDDNIDKCNNSKLPMDKRGATTATTTIKCTRNDGAEISLDDILKNEEEMMRKKKDHDVGEENTLDKLSMLGGRSLVAPTKVRQNE